MHRLENKTGNRQISLHQGRDGHRVSPCDQPLTKKTNKNMIFFFVLFLLPFPFSTQAAMNTGSWFEEMCLC